MTLMIEALDAVARLRDSRIAELESELSAARAADLAAAKAAIRDLAPEDHPLRAVACLVAESLTLDGSGERQLPAEVREVLDAAVRAGQGGGLAKLARPTYDLTRVARQTLDASRRARYALDTYVDAQR